MNNQPLIDQLRGSEAALRAALADVDQSVATLIPAAGRWTILECVEHLVLAEEYLFARLQNASCAAEPVLNERRERRIVERGADRSWRIESPAAARPTGRFATLAAAIDAFSASRARTIDFIAACRDDLRALQTTHPLIGAVNGYEMLLVMAVHPLRHVQQIEEIKAERSASL